MVERGLRMNSGLAAFFGDAEFSVQRLSIKSVEGSLLREKELSCSGGSVGSDRVGQGGSLSTVAEAAVPCHLRSQSWGSAMSSPLLDSCRACLRAECGAVWFYGEPGFVDGDISVRLRWDGMMDIIRLWREADIKGVYWIYWWKPRKGRWHACLFFGWWAVRAEHRVDSELGLSAKNWVSTCLDLRQWHLLELCLCAGLEPHPDCAHRWWHVCRAAARAGSQRPSCLRIKVDKGQVRALFPCPSVVTLWVILSGLYMVNLDVGRSFEHWSPVK